MSKATDPAFPNFDPQAPASDFGWTQGLSKRELIAAMAMQGFCANPAVYAPNASIGWQLVNCSDETLHRICISHADGLLAELAKVAAAPDLLEALQKIVDEGDYTAPEGMKRIARDAIAKATQP